VTGGKGKATAILKVQGMGDSGDAQRLRRAAAKLDGILRVDINYILDSVTVRYDADRLTSAQIKEKLALGSRASVVHPADSGKDSKAS
jgi:copper chaperone CopZ